MSNTLELIIKAVDQASDVIKGVGEAGQTAGGILESNWGKITAGGVAAGAAIMKLGGDALELNTGLRRVGEASGLTESELRKLVIGVTDATFSHEDAIAAMERLNQSGVNQKDQFESLLPVFDGYADATGKDIVQGIDEMDRVLSALGIPLEDAGEHIDTLTHLTTQTTVGMRDLGMVMRREQGNIRDTGLSFDDVAIAMASLEAEGIKGPRAIMRFQEAIQNADGDIDAFWEGLGVGNEVLAEQQDRLGESAGLTQRLAEINNESYTTWDQLRHRISGVTWELGSHLERARELAPVMMAAGPAIKGLSMAKNGLAVATRGVSTAMAFLAANPIVLVIIAIAALAAGLVLLYKNSETFRDIVNAAFEKVKEVATAVFEWIQGVVERVWPHILSVIETVIDVIGTVIETGLAVIMAIWDAVWPVLSTVIEFVWEGIKLYIETYIEIIKTVIEVALNIIQTIWETVWPFLQEYIPPIWEAIKEVVSTAIDLVKGYIETALDIIQTVWETVWPIIRDYVPPIWEAIKSAVESAINFVRDTIDRVINRAKEIWETVWGLIRDYVPPIWDRIKEAVSTAIAFVRDTIDTVINRAREIWETAWGLIQDYVIPVWDRIKETVSAAIDFVRDKVDTVMGTIRDVWETVWGTIRDTAETIWDKIKQVVETAINAVRDTLDTVTGTIRDAWQTVWDRVKQITSDIWDGASGIFNTVKGAIESVRSFLSSTMDRVREGWSSAWNGVKSTVTGIWNEIAGAVRGGINEVISAINYFINAFNGISITIPSITVPGVEVAGKTVIPSVSTPGFSVSVPSIPTIPLLRTGGMLTSDMLFYGHAGEHVINPADSRNIDSLAKALRMAGAGGSQDTNVTVNINGDVYARDRADVHRMASDIGYGVVAQLRRRGVR